MENIITNVNINIEEKRNRLKEKVERLFALQRMPQSKYNEKERKKNNLLPNALCFIGVGIAGVSGVCAIVSDNKVPYVIVSVAAAVSAAVSYKMLKKRSENSNTNNQNKSLDHIKSEIRTNLTDSLRKYANEWETFMEYNQRQICHAINNSTLDADTKNSLLSKVNYYENINIRMMELSSMVNSANTVEELENAMESIKRKVIGEIDKTADCQISKYKSLI